jgi:hypothetical protein
MNTVNHAEPTSNVIANSIVELVESTSGPVTLARITREISGFAEDGAPSRDYFVQDGETECVIWDGMTEAGLAALRNVISERRVAIQFVNPMVYIVENCVSGSENWQPIVLLPKMAANLDTPNWLVRASQGARDYCIERAAKEGRSGYQQLTPCPIRFTADQVAVA